MHVPVNFRRHATPAEPPPQQHRLFVRAAVHLTPAPGADLDGPGAGEVTRRIWAANETLRAADAATVVEGSQEDSGWPRPRASFYRHVPHRTVYRLSVIQEYVLFVSTVVVQTVGWNCDSVDAWNEQEWTKSKVDCAYSF